VATILGRLIAPDEAVQPLGHFNLGGVVTDIPSTTHQYPNIGVAEVYWADLPRNLALQGDTLDESKAWARTVAQRAKRLVGHLPSTLHKPDFEQVEGVIDEIIEGVAVLENLTTVAAKAGIGQFALGALLADYVGGVQLVADFPVYRDQILDRFHTLMTQIVAEAHGDGSLEIYVVAHSEGTVVSLAAILEALLLPTFRTRVRAKSAPTDWIESLRGLMTIGSPLDKHVMLWPNLWTDLGLPSPALGPVAGTGKIFRQMQRRIDWCNYYDFADPIGFDLQATRAYLTNIAAAPYFDWRDGTKGLRDYGFNRYEWPGLAHTDYWTDEKVFGHFLDAVIAPTKSPKSQAPTSEGNLAKLCAPKLYAFSWILHLVALAILVTALNQFVSLDYRLCFSHAVVVVVSLSVMWMSMTVFARLPRLVARQARTRWDYGLAFGIMLVGMVFGAYACQVWLPNTLPRPSPSSLILSRVFSLCPAYVSVPVAGAGLSFFCGWVRHRAPRAGRLLFRRYGWALSGLVVLYVVVLLPAQQGLSFFPVVLAYLAFSYLWWLGVVLFDLTYIWQRYVVRNAAINTLRDWAGYRRTAPSPGVAP